MKTIDTSAKIENKSRRTWRKWKPKNFYTKLKEWKSYRKKKNQKKMTIDEVKDVDKKKKKRTKEDYVTNRTRV